MIVTTSLYLLFQFLAYLTGFFWNICHQYPVRRLLVRDEAGVVYPPPHPHLPIVAPGDRDHEICRLAGLILTQGQADWTRPKCERTIRTVMGGGTWMFLFLLFFFFCVKKTLLLPPISFLMSSTGLSWSWNCGLWTFDMPEQWTNSLLNNRRHSINLFKFQLHSDRLRGPKKGSDE